MKKITFAILAIAFIAAFNSCKEEEEIQTPDEDNWEYFMKQYDENTPHTPGTFVMFGANTYFKNGDEETRTQYSGQFYYDDIEDNSKKYERIDWVNGDKLQIYYNQSSSDDNDAVYAINTHTENERQSVATVTLASEQGLKWGENGPHVFHGTYPAKETIEDYEECSTVKYPQVDDGVDAFTFTSIIPSEQRYNVDMDLAGMIAKTTNVSDKGNVSLYFYPMVTTLQFNLKNVSNNDITIKSIYIDAPGDEKKLSGTYSVTVSSETDNIEGSDDVSIECTRENTISVNEINESLARKSNSIVKVIMFALPVEFTAAKLAINMDIKETINGQVVTHNVTRRVALNEPVLDDSGEVVKDENGKVVKQNIVFQPTHKYNFTIKIPDSTVFEVEEDKDFDVPGGIAPITVTSYTYNAEGEKTPLAWTATRYSIDGKAVGAEGKRWNTFNESVLTPDDYGIRPTMLQGWGVFNTVGAPVSPSSFNATVSYNKPTYRKLKEATPAGDVDLSLVDVSGVPYPGNTLTTVEGKAVTAGNNINTANCYMVHARGTYRFPMVYGNAIKNGVTNTIAFKPTMDRSVKEIEDSITYSPYKKIGTDGLWIDLEHEQYYSLTPDKSRELYFGNTLTNEEKKQLFNVGWGKGWTMDNNPAKNHFLSPFLNHAGNGITDPWLSKNDGVKPSTATLLWQDAEGLIKNVERDGDYITFEVTSEMANLVEGNALIAAKDASGTILWSWHIWITEVKEDQKIESTGDPGVPNDNKSGGVYAGQTMASILIGKKLVENSIPNVTDAKIAAFLGLCDLSVSPREINIEFVQEGTGATEVVTLTQKGLFDVNAPFYQYGRKDPLQFQKGVNGSDRWTFKDFINDDGPVTTSSFSTSPLRDVVHIGITRPTDFCTNNGLDDKYYNLWAARLTRPGRYDAIRADKTKTIYDPCPPGYRVPALADVAGWAGNNNSKGYYSQEGADKYYKGRVIGPIDYSYPYVILEIPGESKNVYVPLLQGRASGAGTLVNSSSSEWWRLTETCSWVSTPIFFSCVQSGFTDTDNNITYLSFEEDKRKKERRTEAFYWYYKKTSYSGHVRTHWDTSDQASHQIRFWYANSWMNESGGNRGNAVNVFMVKERSTDTCSDVYVQETQ